MTTIDMNAKIESWKSKLLDLSKKNRLLNYKETKRSSLKILNPECFELFESFVKNEEPLIFPSVVEHNKDEADNVQEEYDYPIKMNQSPKEAQLTHFACSGIVNHRVYRFSICIEYT